MVLKILFAVVNGNLLARFNLPLRPDPDPPPVDERLSIRLARVVNITDGVRMRSAINKPLRINTEKILPVYLLDFPVRDKWANVLDNPFLGRDGFNGE